MSTTKFEEEEKTEPVVEHSSNPSQSGNSMERVFGSDEMEIEETAEETVEEEEEETVNEETEFEETTEVGETTADEGNEDDLVALLDEEALKKKKSPEEPIHLWITTHSESGAMQDTVEIYAYGKDGCAGPLTVGSGRDGLFKPGATNEVQLALDKNIGALYKIRIGLTEEQPGYEWHLEKLKLKEEMSGQEFEFDVGRWLSRKKDDYDVWRELPVARFEEPPLPVVIYSIEVHTSDISGADTEAPIFINLIGQRGDSGKRRLFVTQTKGKIFSQGKIDRFVLEAVSLGAIKSVVIGHQEKKPLEGWHLSWVAVKEYDTNDEQVETYFPCDEWFDAGHGDEKTERELYPGQRPKGKVKSDGEYRLWVTTAEDSPPPHGGKAVLVVYGDKGHSEDIDLYAPSSTAKLFEPANSDEFEVSTGDIGDVYKIRITREDKPDWNAWHLDEIKMEDKTTGEVYVFSFDRWLSRDMEDGDLSRELPVVSASRDLLTVKSYQVQVATGDHWAAETDANVWVTMFGSNGDSGKRLIHRTKSGKRKFQRGSNDVFTLEAVDLKNLKSVLVSHDGKGPGAGWFLEHITVTEMGGSAHGRFVFPCGRWLDQGEDDGKTERRLRLMDLPKISESHPVPSECGGQWKVKVRTSDLQGADTRAQIYLTVQGTRDMSHPVPLGDGSSSTELFHQGKESMFDVAIGDIGELTKIRLEHDNRNKDPAWHVDWVQMKHLESGFDCLFTFDRWLAEDKEDGQVFRECALESPGWMPSPVLHYIILIQTGRKPNSGAHEGVCSINLIGSQGDTGQQLLTRPLSTAADCMKDGILDVYMLEAVCVGEVRNVRLGFEGKGRAKQWFVESVKVMESLFALSENVFKANCTLDDDNNTAVVLPLSETESASSLPNGVSKDLLGHSIPTSLGSWDICFWTGKQDSAGARDPVSLVLYGTTGPSQPIYLNKEGEFHAGSVVNHKIESGSIGDLFKVRLAFAERNGNASWFLERIKLKDLDSKQEFNFEFNSWIHCTPDNQDGMVELPAVRPDIAPLSETSYMVSVTTGDFPCAETSAEVSLMLIGQWGDSGQRCLTKPRNNKDPFRRGQTDEFELKLLSLGKISKILVGHSEHGRGQGWFCQQVAVTTTGDKGEKIETVFACNRWFDTGVDDRKTLREFSALGTTSSKNTISQTARTASNGIWTCRVKMAAAEKLDVSHVSHGVSHQVSLVVYGSKGVTGPIELGEGKQGEFMPGQVDSFKGLSFGDIGEPTKLRVSSGIEGDKDGTWIVEEIWIEDEMTREKISFDFSQHVGEVGGDVRKEMPVIRPGMKVPALVKYVVRIETEDTQGAGTTARVYATLYGSKGDSGRRLLHTQEGITPFRQGEKKEFEIEAVDLGELEKIVVTKGPGDPWMLNQIIVKAGPYGPVENIFIWSNWVGTSEKRDQEVEITLPVISGRPSTVAVPTNKFPDFPVTRGHWNIETHTGTDGMRGDANDVIVVFCGNKGESSPLNLRAKRETPFQPGMTDTIELSLAEDVGELIKIRLGFEDNSQHKSWHLKKIHFEDSDTRDTFWFSPNSNIAVNDVSDGWKEFPVIWPGVFILPIIRYVITVETGDVPDASTSVQILVKLDGQMGSTGYRVLKDTRDSEAHFQQGKPDKFVIEAVSLMTLDSVTIGHINQTAEAGWFLSRVIVRPDNEEDDYVFVCNRWFDAGKDDGETMRTLLLNEDSSTIVTQPSARPPAAPTPLTDVEDLMHASSAVPLGDEGKTPSLPPTPEPDKAYVYEVTAVTGTGTGHGTHATVVLVLYGDKGKTEPLVIGKEEEKIHLKEGKTQQFKVSIDEDIGDLYKIRVGFESGGSDIDWYSDLYSCPSWFAHSIKLREARTGKEYMFDSRQWVRMEDDHDFWREFPVKKDDPSQMLPIRDYFVDVYTGQRNGSGTNANVYIQLCGERGDSGWRHLHGSRTNANKFETGSHDLFRIEAVDLGKLSKVKVKHDGFGHGSGWYLDKVKVKESEESNQVFLFECDRWLDEGEDDRKLERELPLTAVQSEEEEPESARAEIEETTAPAEEEKYKAGDWRIFTVTSGEPGSGTDAYVTLTVFGSKGDSGPLPLGLKGQGFFEDGQRDQFDIWLEPEDIGEIKKVRLQHDNSGTRPGWRVDQLVMENLLSGEKHTFDINRFLSFDDKEGDVVFEGAVDQPDKPALKAYKYMVKTVTEVEEDAGTDANVYINIIGSEGDTGKRFLMNNIDESPKFAKGKTNYFILEAVDLGNLEKIVIGHDGMGAESSWKLQCVMIRKADSQTKETSVFPWGKWLADETDSEVTIFASDELQLDEDETTQDSEAQNNEDSDEMPDLHLALPETARTDNQGTYRTDEGYQESDVDDGTYRTDESLPMNNIAEIPSETEADQTARMYTATDSSVDAPQSPPTDNEAIVSNRKVSLDMETARTNNNEEENATVNDTPDPGDDFDGKLDSTEKENSDLENNEAADNESEQVDETGEEDDKMESLSARPEDNDDKIKTEEDNSEANNEDEKGEVEQKLDSEENPDEAKENDQNSEQNSAEANENPEDGSKNHSQEN